LLRNGVPKGKVLSIPVGRDTLTQTKSYITEMKKRNLETVIIATDAYHCNRAITMAKDFDAIASCSPSQSGPNTLEKSRYRYLIREAGAYLSYITLGRRGIHISDHLTNGSLVRYVYDPGK
jgi:vancomycin permeability regulator SanA